MKKLNSNFNQKICLADDREISVELVRDRTSGTKEFCRIMEAYCQLISSIISEKG